MSTSSGLCVNSVRRLIYWRTPWKTAVCLCLLVAAEVSLLYRSIISVFSWGSLFFLAYSASLRVVAYVYANFITSSKKKAIDAAGDEAAAAHLDASASSSATVVKEGPLNDFGLQKSFSREETEDFIRRVLDRVNHLALTGRDLFLINKPVESLKFAIFLYLMTYVGARFNFLTLVILGTLVTFTTPKIYETFQTEIDGFLAEVKKTVEGIYGHFRMKVSQLPVVSAILAGLTNENEPQDAACNGKMD